MEPMEPSRFQSSREKTNLLDGFGVIHPHHAMHPCEFQGRVSMNSSQGEGTDIVTSILRWTHFTTLMISKL